MAAPPQKAKLGAISFGLAIGVTAAIFAFVLGLAAGMLGWGEIVVGILSHLFIGYQPTFVGSIAGAVWAFVNGFIGGVLVATFYNLFLTTRH